MRNPAHGKTAYNDDRTAGVFLPQSFCAISRVIRRQEQDACLHAGLRMTSYDEQRERKMRSILSLLICKVRKTTDAGRSIYLAGYVTLPYTINRYALGCREGQETAYV